MNTETNTPANTQDNTGEFVRIANVADLTVAKTTIKFKATPDELKALAKRLLIDGLKSLKGRAIVQILPNDNVLAEVSFKAQVEQHCGVTLEPIVTDVSTEYTTTYSKEIDEDWGLEEEESQDQDEHIDPFEPIIEGKIDLGEMCIEQLALEIDPFPRVQGATFDGYSALPKGLDASAFEKKNPFAALSKLKTTKENNE